MTATALRAETTDRHLFGHFEYRLMFRRPSDGCEVAGGTVAGAWLAMAREQALFQAQRAGLVDADLGPDQVFEEPRFVSGASGQVSGIRLTICAGGRTFEHDFGLEVFEAAAQQELERLLKLNQLAGDDKAVYQVFAHPAVAQAGDAKGSVTATVTRRATTFLEGNLDDWLPRARARGPADESAFPLVILEQALERAREYCFRPGGNEAGAMLVGHLYRQSHPRHEIFGVADAAIELRHARHEKFSLVLTPETWTDLNRQLELRQKRLGRPHEVPLVLAHSHQFLPSLAENGEANCPKCHLRPTCQLTSSFYSTGDVRFHAALFSKAPWVSGLVLGLTPREEHDLRLFCLDGARSRERGYYTICEKPATQE